MAESSCRRRNHFLWAGSLAAPSSQISESRHAISSRNSARQVALFLVRLGLRLWLDPMRRTCVGSYAHDSCDARIRLARNQALGGLFCGLWDTFRFRGPEPHPFSHGLSEITPALALGRTICRCFACQCRRPFVL